MSEQKILLSAWPKLQSRAGSDDVTPVGRCSERSQKGFQRSPMLQCTSAKLRWHLYALAYLLFLCSHLNQNHSAEVPCCNTRWGAWCALTSFVARILLFLSEKKTCQQQRQNWNLSLLCPASFSAPQRDRSASLLTAHRNTEAVFLATFLSYSIVKAFLEKELRNLQFKLVTFHLHGEHRLTELEA